QDRFGRSAGFDLAAVKAALASHDSADHPVCVPKGKKAAFTFASTVMVLSDAPEFHVAPEPPDVPRYETLRFPKCPGDDRPAVRDTIGSATVLPQPPNGVPAP